MCASACYYIVSAADEIYALDSSLVGSIGVKLEGWDFQTVLDKVGVKRRSYTAGEHKSLFDPYKPVSEVESDFIQDRLLTTLHKQFISAVKAGRGNRLSNDPDIFTGLIWTGTEAVDKGLIDGVLTPSEVGLLIDERHGVSKLIYHGQQKFSLSNMFGMDSDVVIDAFASSLIDSIKESSSTPSVVYRVD